MYLTILFMLGCSGNEKENIEETGDVTNSSDETGETGITIPSPPEPFEITISGTDNETLSFDTPTCQIPEAVPNFNLYWRLSSGAHKFVLRVFINADYEGAGEYDNSTHNISIRLQEEAGGSGRFYQSDLEQGDEVTGTIETDEGDTIWGTINIASMHNSDSSITLQPSSFPVWCSAENTN
jgi:hypothetical protein